MIGLRLALTQAARLANRFWYSGAALDGFFAQNLYSDGQQAVSLADIMSVQRASAQWAQDLTGQVIAFASNEPRLTDAGLTLTGGATRLHGMCPEYTILNSGVAVSSGVTELGMTSKVYTTTLDATWRGLRVNQNIPLVSGTPIHWRLRFRLGTSGRVGPSIGTTAGSSTMLYQNSGWSVETANSGSHTIHSTVDMGSGILETVGTFLPTVTDSNAQFSLQIQAEQVGGSLEVFGFQVTDTYSDWILGGGTNQVSTAADQCQLNLTGITPSNGFMLRMDGEITSPVSTVEDQRFYHADDGSTANQCTAYVVRNDGGGSSQWPGIETLYADASQGSVFHQNPVLPPQIFRLVGGHGPDFTQMSWNDTLSALDGSGSYQTPTRIFIGSDAGTSCLPLRLTRLTLLDHVPSSAALQALAA